MRPLLVDGPEGFRSACRSLVADGTTPDQVSLLDAGAGQLGLPLGAEAAADRPEAPPLSLPRDLAQLVARVGCHRDPERWQALYRLIYRACRGERHVARLAADPDVARVLAMDSAVRRDVHKTHAFVRFRRVELEGDERFVAYHRPDHLVLPLAAPFFVDRFGSMRWSILTPDACAHWDRESLTFSPGAPSREAPAPDELEALFREYYRSVFNPARIKLEAMRAEMPKKHWATLPETEALPEMLREAEARVAAMLGPQAPGRRGRLLSKRRP